MRHRRNYRPRVLGASALLATALAVVGAGCSVSVGGTTLDTDKLENEINDQIDAQLDRVGDLDVSCPSDVDVDEGATFRCTITLPGGEEREVLVTQVDGEGNVRWNVAGE